MHLGLDLGAAWARPRTIGKRPYILQLLPPFPLHILVCSPNNFDKSTPVHVQEIQM